MKQKMVKAVALVCFSVLLASSVSACRPGGGKNLIDKNKTQLYIGNYDGGFGHEWLDEYIKEFEEKYKDVSFEEGKMGVDVQTINDKPSLFATNLLQTMDQSNLDIIFTEEFPYYQFVRNATGNLLYDITGWVTEKLPGEEKSIVDKMNDRQKTYYTSVDGKYYGLPHYQSLRGLIYDVDLFNEKSLFIKEDGTIAGKSTDTNLSAGPDGRKGTYDDGLPATYDELWTWCEFVSTNKKVTPFSWTGAYKEAYSKYLEDALIVDTLGSEAGQYFFSQSDTEVTMDLIRSFDANGKPVITSETISRDNSNEMCMSAAGYYMLDFWKHILDNNWYYKDSLNDLTTHDIIHYDYLRSRFDPSIQPIAFLIEGAWWENESDYIFEELDKAYPGEGAGRSDRHFGYLPLPKARAEYAGSMTLLDANNSIMVVNANIKGNPEEEVAKKFVQFIHTDKNLQFFNTSTSIARDFDFSLTAEQKTNLTPFAKQLLSVRENATGIVYARENSFQDSTYGALNGSGVDFRKALSLDGKTWYMMPLATFTESATKNMTAREYFECVYNKYY